jgi:hypothetical protein
MHVGPKTETFVPNHPETKSTQAAVIPDEQPKAQPPSIPELIKHLESGNIRGAKATVTSMMDTGRTRRDLVQELENSQSLLGRLLGQKLKPELAGEERKGVGHILARAANAVRSHLPLVGDTPDSKAKSIHAVIDSLAKEINESGMQHVHYSEMAEQTSITEDEEEAFNRIRNQWNRETPAKAKKMQEEQRANLLADAVLQMGKTYVQGKAELDKVTHQRNIEKKTIEEKEAKAKEEEANRFENLLKKFESK